MQIKTAIIAAAGFGTRFLPATKTQPKEMLPVVDKPIVQWIVEDLTKAGIKNIIFITSKNKRALEDHFDSYPELENVLRQSGKMELLKTATSMNSLANFSYVRQKEPLGNADAIKQALHLLLRDEPALVMWGDEILIDENGQSSLKTQMELFEKLKKPVFVLCELPKDQVSAYGVAKIKPTGESGVYEILDVVEKPKPQEAPSNYAVIGRYALTGDFLSLLNSFNGQNELGITDVTLKYLKQGGKIYGWEFKGKRFDCGSKIGLLKASVYYGLRHPETAEEFQDYLRGINA